MGDRYVLTFDVGTQSARALLVSQEGQIKCKKQIKYDPPYVSPEIGWAEQDPDLYFKYISQASLMVKNEMPKEFEKIVAVTLTTFRDTSVYVDNNGKPLRPAIVWLDSRMAKGEPDVKGIKKTMLKAVGMMDFVTLQYRKSQCNWVRENQKDIWDKTDKVLLLSGYLTYRLTGQMTDAAASLVGHIPFDNKIRNWMDPGNITYPVFPIPKEKLCNVTDTGDTMGTITEEAANATGIKQGIPVIATGSDQACQLMGLGCMDNDQVSMGLGTMGTLSFNIDKYFEPEKYKAPYPSVMKNCFNPEYEVYRGYWLVSWFKKELAQKDVDEAAKQGISTEELLNKCLDKIPAGCDGLLFQPYFTAGITMPVAGGSFIGLRDYHTKEHMYKAIIEGINFALMQGCRSMETKGNFRFKEIRIGGGAGQSSEICQITADMYGIPVVRTENFEATGLGSAMAGFVGIGDFGDLRQAREAMVHIRDTFTPDMEKHKVYDRLFNEVYKEIFPKLLPLYAKTADIVK